MANSVTDSIPVGAKAAVCAEGTKDSISLFIIRPPSPDPFTLAIAIPFSSANFLAKGEAMIRPEAEGAVVTGAETVCCATGAGAATGVGSGVETGSGDATVSVFGCASVL